MHRFTSFIKVAKPENLDKKITRFLCKKFAKSFQCTGALKVRALEQKKIELYRHVMLI